MPDERVDSAGGLVEAIGFERLGDGGKCVFALACDPPVNGLRGRSGIETFHWRAGVDLGEARGVPQLGREIAVALDAAGAELDVAALRRHGGGRESQRVGAVKSGRAPV